MKTMATLASMLAVACAVTVALAQDDPATESKPQPAPKELTQAEKDALATRAYFVLRNRCWGCHGEPGKQAYGLTAPLDWILDYDKLIEAKLVVPGSARQSRIVYLTTLGKMPREFDAQGKPSKEGELPQAEQEALTAWVKAGAPKWPEMTFTHEWVRLPLPSPIPELDEEQRKTIRCLPGHDGQPLIVWKSAPNNWQARAFVDGAWVIRPWKGGADPGYIVVDTKRQRMIGVQSELSDGTGFKGLKLWTSDGTGWQPEPISSLGRRKAGFGMVYDPDEDRVILYGGVELPAKISGTTFLPSVRETWQWKDGQWKQLEMKEPPNNTEALGMIFDPKLKKVLLLTSEARPKEAAKKADGPDFGSLFVSDEHRSWYLGENEWVGVEEDPWLDFGTGRYASTPTVVWDHSLEKPVLTFDDVREGQTRVWTGKSWEPIAQSPFFYPEWTIVHADTKGKRLIALHMPFSNEDGAFETWALIPWRKAK